MAENPWYRKWLPVIPALQRRATTAQILAHNLHAGDAGPALPRRGDQLAPTMRTAIDADAPDLRRLTPLGKEHGVSGTEIFGGQIHGEEYNPDLVGPKWIEKADQMRRNDAQINAILSAIKLPLRSALWQISEPQAKGADLQDKMIAEFCQRTIMDDDAMQDGWDYVLRHILLQLEFGFSVLEKIWTVDSEGFFRIKRLAPRLPKTIWAWHVRRDGTLRYIWQYAPVIDDTSDGRHPLEPSGISAQSSITRLSPTGPTSSFRYLAIPAKYACVFTREREGDNYEGISALRGAYKAWFYKDLFYHIEGIRLDRYGVGIPTANLEEGHNLSKTELNNLEETLKQVRVNEHMYLIAPPGVRYEIMTPKTVGAGTVKTLELIDHMDAQIARNVLAGFLSLGRDARGTQGFGSRLTDLFVSSLYGVVAGITADLKKSVIKPLCDLNFDMTGRDYPEVRVRDLESVDLERLSTILLQAAGTLITPDDGLEATLRQVLRVPDLPADLTRKARKKAEENRLKTSTEGEGDLGGAAPPADPANPDTPVDPASKKEDFPNPERFEVVENVTDPNNPWAVVNKVTGVTVARFPERLQGEEFVRRREAELAPANIGEPVVNPPGRQPELPPK